MVDVQDYNSYPSNEIQKLWGDMSGVISERALWLLVLRFQIENGAVDQVRGMMAYSDGLKAMPDVDMESIHRRELTTRHDLKARLDEYNYISGDHGLFHVGMTSADVVDNINLWRMNETVKYFNKTYGTEFRHLPFRGIKGAVGTAQDQLDLLGTAEKCQLLDTYLAEALGFETVLNSVGQVYPRSIDGAWATDMLSVIRVPTTRIICAGYANMLLACGGDQWNEGDVSTSIVRRIALSGMAIYVEIGLKQQMDNQNE